MISAPRRPFCLLVPLLAWQGLGLFLIFFVNSGHWYAASPSLTKFEAAPVCSERAYAPRATRSRWGSGHGQPLVIVHVSDLHISDVDGQSPKEKARSFAHDVLPRFNNVADAIAITGDLVSSKQYPRWPFSSILGYSSVQIADEWEWASRVIVKAAEELVAGGTSLFVVPGNHDMFGSRRSFEQFITRQTLPKSNSDALSRVQAQNVRGHSFIELDATLSPSPHRPLNFFGHIDRLTASRLEMEFAGENTDPEEGSIVCLCHYPSSVLGSGQAIDDAIFSAIDSRPSSMSLSKLYLSGHLHSMRGALPGGMQAVSRSGRVELQLPDMASSGSFRIIAVDHGVPSWADFQVPLDRSQPMILVMNPPRAGHCPPGAGFASLQSSHIRLMVVPGALPDVASSSSFDLSVRIDGVFVGKAKSVKHEGSAGLGHAVLVIPWNSSRYWGDGLVHQLDVFVQENFSERHLLSHPFSLDGRLSPGFGHQANAFMGAFFTLSRFDRIAKQGTFFGIFSILVLAVIGIPFSHIRAQSLCVVAFCAALIGNGPVLVAMNLSDEGGFGFASISKLSVREGTLSNPVDPLFAMFFVLNTAVLPAVYLMVVSAIFPDASFSWLFSIARVIALVRSWTWTLNVAGAHGAFSAAVSFSCLPQTMLVLWCASSHRAKYQWLAKEKGT